MSSPVEAAPRVFPCSYVSTRFNDNWWQTLASAINNLGEVSGTLSLGSNQKSKGFRREADGSFLPAPWFGPSIDVRLTGINDLGQYTGYYNDGNSHAFLSTAEGDVFFDVHDATHTEPVAINNSGQVAGSYRYTTWLGEFVYWKGFIRETDRSITYLENAHYPTALNNLGVTVGYFMVNEGPTSTATGAMGFWHDSSGIHRFGIPYPGFAQMYIPGLTPRPRLSINDQGQIAGTFYDGDHHAHGFVASIDGSGNINFGSPIDFPGGDTVLSGINDVGQVAGIRFTPGAVSPEGYGNVDVFMLNAQGIPSQITSDTLIHGGVVGINNQGEVVAYESEFPGPIHALLFSPSCVIVNVP